MKYVIDNQVFDQFPSTMLGVIIFKDIDNTKPSEHIMKQIKEQEQEIKANFKPDEISSHPKLGCWRAVYKAFGEKPKKYQASIENMYRRVFKGETLPSINHVVDVYNLISVKHMVSAGGEDLDCVHGDVHLTIAKGDEPFTELQGDEIKHPKPGEVIYKDDNDVLCRRWNWRQCAKTKITENSKNISLIIEAVEPFTKQEVELITQELAELAKQECGGEFHFQVLDKNNPEIKI